MLSERLSVRTFLFCCLTGTLGGIPDRGHGAHLASPCTLPSGSTPFSSIAFSYPVGSPLIMPTPGDVPLNGFRITRNYLNTESRHLGVDLARANANISDNVRAIGAGTVVYVQEDDRTTGFGHMTRIEHRLPGGRFVYSQYAHLRRDSILVTCGQTVFEGEQVGIVGSTGNVTGPHLHFEVKDINTNGCGYAKSRFCSGADVDINNYQPPLEFIDAPTRDNFEFAVSFFSVDGNILGSGASDNVFDFFDNFNDGSVTRPPTSLFLQPQPITESGGFLLLRSIDGTRETFRFGATFLEDSVSLQHLLRDGRGNAEIIAAFRTVVPRTRQFYGIGIVNGSGSGILESIFIGLRGDTDGVSRIRVNDHIPQTTAADPVPSAFAPGKFILFKLSVNDSTNQVVGV